MDDSYTHNVEEVRHKKIIYMIQKYIDKTIVGCGGACL